ncbi:hypothetical protein D3C87_1749990 [compost metagenome]
MRAVTVTLPPAGVNLMALVMRLERICSMRWGSMHSRRAAGRADTSSLMLASSAAGLRLSTSSWTLAPKSARSSCNLKVPASIRAYSSRSLTRRSRRLVLLKIWRVKLSWVGESAPPAPSCMSSM